MKLTGTQQTGFACQCFIFVATSFCKKNLKMKVTSNWPFSSQKLIRNLSILLGVTKTKTYENEDLRPKTRS